MSSKQIKLPPLKQLRMKRAKVAEQANPCVVLLSTMLNCWSSNGESSPACKEVEESLKMCLETNKKAGAKKSSVNYHANRLYQRFK